MTPTQIITATPISAGERAVDDVGDDDQDRDREDDESQPLHRFHCVLLVRCYRRCKSRPARD